MNLFALAAAFGGGAFGASIGALYAFIMTGFMAIAGGTAGMAGAANFVKDSIAFGPFFGPHVSFAGAVAAAAYAANKKKLIGSGTEISTPLHKTGRCSVLIVGGVFGMFGFLLQYVYGTVLALPTDTIAMAVATSAVIVRLMFGSAGLLGKYDDGERRIWLSGGSKLKYNIILGAAVGLMAGGTGISIMSRMDRASYTLLTDNYPIICFGIAAVTLTLAHFGNAGPAAHHIALPAANAALLSAAKTGNLPLGAAMGVLFGVVCSLLGDFMSSTFNTHADTHIDPPACTIFPVTFIIFALFG